VRCSKFACYEHCVCAAPSCQTGSVARTACVRAMMCALGGYHALLGAAVTCQRLPALNDLTHSFMKTCPGCGAVLPRDAFGPNTGRRDGLQSYCRPCMRAKDKRHYERHHARRRSALVAWTRRRRDVNARFVLSFLVDHPCIDCGESDPIVLEFDHVRGRKRAPIERLVSVGCSREALLVELDKCVVRCANCHRRRTAQTRGYRRYRFVAEQSEKSASSHATALSATSAVAERAAN
jgi:hypothetical protein